MGCCRRVVRAYPAAYFQQAEAFAQGDIRYQGFENREELGRDMITICRRKVNLFEVFKGYPQDIQI